MSTNLLAPPGSLQSGVSTTGNSLQLIDTAAQGMLSMPIDSSTIAPSLQADMQAAQALATQWTTQIRPDVVNTLNGIVSYNSLFASLFSELYSLSEQIAAGDSSAIPSFQAELQQLYNATQAQYQIVQAVQQVLMNYSTAVSGSQQSLNSDAGQLQNVVAADQSQMQVYDQEMDYLETQEQIVYMDIIKNQGRPALQEFQIMMDELEQTIQKLNDQMNTVGNQMSTDQQQINDLQKDLNDLSGYLTDLSQLQGGVTGLANGWEALSGDYANLLQDETITSYSVFTPDDVQAAASDWAELSQLAESFIS